MKAEARRGIPACKCSSGADIALIEKRGWRFRHTWSRRTLIRPLVASFFLASLSVKADAGAPAQWYQNLTIKYLYAGQVGDRVAVRFHQTISMGDCYNGQEVIIDSSNPHFKSILAMLMTAYATRSPINIYTNGACASYGVLGTDVSLGEM